MQLLWWPAADAVLSGLEADLAQTNVLRGVRRTLGRLEIDPYDPRLRTRQFVTERYGQLRTMPVGIGEWRIFWMSGPEADEITIVYIAETAL